VSTPPPPTAEDLFAEFLERVEAGGPADFASWVGEHPGHEPTLRRIHARWQAMTVAFASLSQAPAGEAAADDSAALAELLQRLGTRADRWSRYAVGPEIARGAMGKVLRAWDCELRRDVALKVQRAPAGDGRSRRRFVEEAQISAQLDHPGIVPIHELGLDEAGQPFFAMRLVEGRDLGEVLELARTEADGWSRTRVLHVLLRVCETMAYAHHKGVVHRDLKPGNVMVCRFGATYVMDWGLARVLGNGDEAAPAPAGVDSLRAQIAGEDDASPLLTRSGDVVGTPAYMAPELATGAAAAATAAADVYALGAILYHLLAGAVPYRTAAIRTADEVLVALGKGPPAPLPDDTPAELRAICERAMARDPAARYPSMQALGDDLRAFLELRVVSAYATGRFAELRKWIARNRALAACSLGLVLALAAGVLVAGHLWLTAEAAHVEAHASADRLEAELDRSRFRNARLLLRSEDAASAGEMLWAHHLGGRKPRATRWSLLELAERNPVLATQPIPGHLATVFSRATGAVLLAGEDGALHVLDPETLAARQRLARDGCHFVSVIASATQPWAVAGDRDGGVTWWNLTTGEAAPTVRAHRGAVEQLECGPDQRSFVSADAAGEVLWWSAPDAAPRQLAALGQRATAIAIDGDGARVAVGAESGRLCTFSLAGEKLWERRIGADQIMDLSFGPGGRDLWVGSRAITVVDAASGEVRRTIPSRNGTYRALVHDADGSVIAGGWWRIDRFAGEPPADAPLALVGCWRLDLDPVARRIVSKQGAAALDLIDIGQRDLRWLPSGRATIALARDGRAAVTLVGRDAVRFDLATGGENGRVPGIGGGWLATDRNAGLVAVIGRGKQGVQVADFATGKVRYRLDGPGEVPFNESACFSPDGTEIAVVVGNDCVRVHSAADGAVRAEFTIADSRIIRLCFAGDGAHLAVGWRGCRAVRVYDRRDGSFRDVPFELPQPEGTTSTLASLAVDERAQRVAVGNWSGSIAVVDTRPGRQGQRLLQAHSGTVWSLGFLPTDPDLLVSSAGSGGITFWDLDSGEACHQPARLPAPVAQVQFSDDGTTLACFTTAGPVAVDLEYRERHVAGILEPMLRRARAKGPVDAAREAELRDWAQRVLARPWPRWR